MQASGFLEIECKWRRDGKMAYWLYQKQVLAVPHVEKYQKKVILRQGNKNNFCILLT